jgi:hypothetical protein
VKEFDEILHYTQYSKQHLNVYSIRNMNLIVRIGQSVENISKVVEKSICGKESYHCLDSFDNISNVFSLEKKKIYLSHPLQSSADSKLFVLNPFKKSKYPRLKKDGIQKVDGSGNLQFEYKAKWYNAYTEIKHNPTDGLKLATLENLTNAFSAFYVLYIILNFGGDNKYFQFKDPYEENTTVITSEFLDRSITSCFLPFFWTEENNDLFINKRDICLFLIVRPEKRFNTCFEDLNFEENLVNLNNSINSIDKMEEDNPILKAPTTVGWVNSFVKATLIAQNSLKWIIKLNNLNKNSPEVIESKERLKSSKKINS